jgi:CRISPR/Cas system-associated protein Csm6
METLLITPVGTSLFRNYKDHGPGRGGVERHYQRIEHERGDRWDDRKGIIDALRDDTSLTGWIESTDAASAEMESASKIAAQEEASIHVRLLASDTIASWLAAELIRDHAGIANVEFSFTPDLDLIPDLQVFDAASFGNGVRHLVRRVRGLLKERGERMGKPGASTCAINITGGYKATLPYLTVLGELYDVPLRYKFEEADGMLSIPQVPIALDEDLFREHEAQFAALDEGVDDWSAFRDANHAFAERAEDLIEVADNMALLSPLGELFWGYYTDQHVCFYAPDEVYRAIREEQPNVRRILKTKIDQLRRGHQVETKGDHRVFDDGDNSNRIYFFTHDEDLYIYKTFDERGEHDDHEAYYKNVSFDASDRRSVQVGASRRRLQRAA